MRIGRARSGPLAGPGAAPYLAAMGAYLMRLLVLIAVLTAPLTMVGQAAAAPVSPAAAPQAMAGHHPMVAEAADGAMPARHCAGAPGDAPDDAPAVALDCTTVCAALTGSPASLADRTLPSAAATVVSPAQVLAGIWPERETPPPRAASQI